MASTAPQTCPRRRTRFRTLALVSLAAVAGLGVAAAEAAAPFVVVDVGSGRVVMQEDATMPWHPASVTKLMTAYVALKAMREGQVGWETPVPVSVRASKAAPSKIGVRPGQEVTLENALKMLMVKSANDMAIVIAEGVGGSVEGFATMMNAEARRLGMRESHFINPNGLHAEGQQTSARDMAILARALLLEFPDHRDLFSIPAIQLGDRIMNNTNGLIGRYPGIEGMKTGFVCASGFNLVAVAQRNGQRLIAVVMGQPSAAERTIKAATLLDKGFGSSPGGGGLFSFGSTTTLDALPRSPVGVAPNMREEICVRRKGPPASEDELDRAPATPVAFSGDGINIPSGQSFAAAMPGSSVRGAGGPRSLSPRAPLEPVAVFLGRSPGSGNAPIAVNARAIPARPDAPATATAFTGDRARGDGSRTGPMVLAPATMVPLKAGAATAIGTGAKASPAPRLGAVNPASPPQSAKPATAPAKPAAARNAKTKPPATAAKPAAAKPTAPKAKATGAAPAKPPAKPATKPAAAPAAPSAKAKKPAADS